jgi:hypothetical protein
MLSLKFSYRCEPDSREDSMNPQPIEIAVGTHGIEREVLHWSESAELWDDHALGDRFSVFADVLDHCRSVDIESEEYDFEVPGLSGRHYRITTNDPDQLRDEIRVQIMHLIRPPPVQMAKQAPHSDKPSRPTSRQWITPRAEVEAARIKLGFRMAAPDHPIYSEPPTIMFVARKGGARSAVFTDNPAPGTTVGEAAPSSVQPTPKPKPR